MSPRERTLISEESIDESGEVPIPGGEPLEVVYELLKRDDGSVWGIGNSKEVTRREAIDLIRAGLCKHESKPIGELPDGWL